MNELNTQRRWAGFSMGFWVALGIVGMGGALLFWPVQGPPRERRPRVVDEAYSIRVAMYRYQNTFGSFPTGDTRAICHALRGGNSRKEVFIELSSLSPEGDFLDPWGMPYEIYFSGDSVLVRSAGVNKRFDRSGDKGFDDWIY